MKAGIYSPYWDTLGGGEYYAANVADILGQLGYRVELLSPMSDTLEKLHQRFNLTLKNASVNSAGYHAITKSFATRALITKSFDVVFWVSDGSIPTLFAKKNILHFQVPFQNVPGHTLINRLKLTTIDHIVCNSHFTAKIIDRHFQVKSRVVYPAVIPVPASRDPKQKIILSVGRFDGHPFGKRQDILIDSFIKLKMSGWQLILVGGVLDQKCTYLANLKKMAQNYPIQILTNLDYEALSKLYQQASLYWHANGFGTDIDHQPENTEHFGISVVEAMSAGAIPIVFNGGGLPEIVDENCGYLWHNQSELIAITQAAIAKLKDELFLRAIHSRSNRFTKGVFDEKFKKIIA